MAARRAVTTDVSALTIAGARLTGRMEATMEEETAMWLLGLAHSEYEAVRSELDEADRARASLVRERDELREAHRRMLDERIALRDERDAARAEADALRVERDRTASHRDYLREELDRASDGASAERVHYLDQLEERRVEIDALRAERDALKAAARGWFRVGEWAYVNLDGRIVRNTNGEWAAEDADRLFFSPTAVESARAAGWRDFPGASDHSAGDP